MEHITTVSHKYQKSTIDGVHDPPHSCLVCLSLASGNENWRLARQLGYILSVSIFMPNIICITKTTLFKYTEHFATKNENFQIKKTL